MAIIDDIICTRVTIRDDNWDPVAVLYYDESDNMIHIRSSSDVIGIFPDSIGLNRDGLGGWIRDKEILINGPWNFNAQNEGASSQENRISAIKEFDLVSSAGVPVLKVQWLPLAEQAGIRAYGVDVLEFWIQSPTVGLVLTSRSADLSSDPDISDDHTDVHTESVAYYPF